MSIDIHKIFQKKLSKLGEIQNKYFPKKKLFSFCKIPLTKDLSNKDCVLKVPIDILKGVMNIRNYVDFFPIINSVSG